MDSKLTKKRLSNFLSYEWILMIVAIVGVIFVFEILYTSFAVRLTAGQTYSIIYDKNISPRGDAFYDSLMYNTENSVFSYDVLDLVQETNSEEVDLLETRFAVQRVDIVVTDTLSSKENKWDNRANSLVDFYNFQDITSLKSGMETYLLSFMNGDSISAENLNKEEIKNHFLERMKGDNRFRSQEEKEKGIKQEIKRFETLCAEYKFFEKAYEYGVENNWFYSYHRFEYELNVIEEKSKEYIQTLYDKENEKFWGLNVGALTNGKVEVGEYFKIKERKLNDDEQAENAEKNIVILVADYGKDQVDLQYETVSVINRLIQNCVSEDVYKAW